MIDELAGFWVVTKSDLIAAIRTWNEIERRKFVNESFAIKEFIKWVSFWASAIDGFIVDQ